MKRTASVTWSGSVREGEGTFHVGSGAITAPYTYNSGHPQEELDRVLEQAMVMCPICNALTGSDVRVTIRAGD